MRPDLSHAPAASHSIRTTVAAAALVVAVTLAAVVAASAPQTAATVAVTAVGVLAVQRGVAAVRSLRFEPIAVEPAETA